MDPTTTIHGRSNQHLTIHPVTLPGHSSCTHTHIPRYAEIHETNIPSQTIQTQIVIQEVQLRHMLWQI